MDAVVKENEAESAECAVTESRCTDAMTSVIQNFTLTGRPTPTTFYLDDVRFE